MGRLFPGLFFNPLIFNWKLSGTELAGKTVHIVFQGVSMKKSAFAGALFLLLPSAWAGPNWEVIHQARHDLARREAMHMVRCKTHPVASVQLKGAKSAKQAG
jgi:hypothetical protein